jgi:hypothetical protein
VFQMPLSISSTTRHGSQSQHYPTLTLFEIRMQRPMSRYPAEEYPNAATRRVHHANPHDIRAGRKDAVKAKLASRSPNCSQRHLILRASF